MSKIIWVGGVHGVGKTSSLKLASARCPTLEYLYLGKMFYETADRMGYQWMELADRDNLLRVERTITKEIRERMQYFNLLVDCHFAIHFGDKITYPGFHKHNLEFLSSQNGSKTGVISLTGNSETILQRRKKSNKRIKSYITQEDKEIVKKELLGSQTYFNYFIDALGPHVASKKIDTSFISIEEVADKIGRMYDTI